MSKKYKFIFCGIAFALAAIIAGLCFVFFGNKTIKAIPKTVEVKKIEDDYFLVAELSGEYNYQFKLEQFIEDGYMVIELVDSTTNSIKLKDSSLNIIAGGDYRFSARYTNENGKGNGKFSEAIPWSPTWALSEVDYEKVTFEEDTLSWEAVPEADSYSVLIFDNDLGECEPPVPNGLTCDLSSLAAGQYTVYVIAESEEEYIESSAAGQGKTISISRKNTLTNAQISGHTLTVQSEYEIEKFQIFVDEQLVGTIDVGQRNNKIYTISNLISIFDGVDLAGSKIEIKSLKRGLVLDSDRVLVSVN